MTSLKTWTRLIIWSVLLCFILYLVVDYVSPLLKTALEPPSDLGLRSRLFADTQRLIRVMGVGLFIGLLGTIRIGHLIRKNAADPAIMRRRINWSWFAGAGVTLLLVSGTIVYANPRRYYGPTIYPSPRQSMRWVKMNLYSKLPQTPDIVILGSSQAYGFSPRHIQNSLGYTAFNAAVDAGNLNDALILTRYMVAQDDQTTPKVLFVELKLPLNSSPGPAALMGPISQLRYMDWTTMRRAISGRLEGLFDLLQFAEAVYYSRYTEVHGVPQPTDLILSKDLTLYPDGMVKLAASQERFETWLEKEIQGTRAPQCKTINARTTQVTEELLDFAGKRGISVIFVITPRHPSYYQARMETNKKYITCHQAVQDFMAEMIRSHEGVFFLDYSLLDSIGGIVTHEGYIDGHHMTELNSNLLLDAAAGTIRQAYDTAVQKQARF